MPYIKQSDQECFEEMFKYVVAKNPGDLNYLMTRCAVEYLLDQDEITYAALNSVVGAFECAKQEFVRRVVTPYEDKKIKENGDIYPEELTHA